MSLSDCLTIGVLDNIEIKLARIEAKIGKEDVRMTLSMFDTMADGAVSYADDQRGAAASAFGCKMRPSCTSPGSRGALPHCVTCLSLTERTFISLLPILNVTLILHLTL